MFSIKIFFRKIQTIFDTEKWLWMSEIFNFVTLSPLSEKVQKIFQCNFCDSTSISFIVISFHQISLTWWNAYRWCTLYYSILRNNSSIPIIPWWLRYCCSSRSILLLNTTWRVLKVIHVSKIWWMTTLTKWTQNGCTVKYLAYFHHKFVFFSIILEKK